MGKSRKGKGTLFLGNCLSLIPRENQTCDFFKKKGGGGLRGAGNCRPQLDRASLGWLHTLQREGLTSQGQLLSLVTTSISPLLEFRTCTQEDTQLMASNKSYFSCSQKNFINQRVTELKSPNRKSKGVFPANISGQCPSCLSLALASMGCLIFQCLLM